MLPAKIQSAERPLNDDPGAHGFSLTGGLEAVPLWALMPEEQSRDACDDATASGIAVRLNLHLRGGAPSPDAAMNPASVTETGRVKSAQ